MRARGWRADLPPDFQAVRQMQLLPNKLTVAVLLAVAPFAAGCGARSSATTSATLDGGATSVGEGGACSFPLVKLVTGPDSSCGGDQAHWWPVGMPAEACHGWAAVDTSGREHLNSAKNIRCNADGSFSFDQHAGNLTCSGTGKTKVYRLDRCDQDTPPSLFTKAVDLGCCATPPGAGCTIGLPSVDRAGSAIDLDNVRCSP